MRRLAAERGRRRLRARGGRAPRTREAGVAVRAHYGALPLMAGRGTGQGGKPHPPRPRKHGPRSEIAAVARRKALRGSLRRRRRSGPRQDYPSRLSARCPPRGCEGKPKLPSGSSSHENASAWLFPASRTKQHVDIGFGDVERCAAVGIERASEWRESGAPGRNRTSTPCGTRF